MLTQIDSDKINTFYHALQNEFAKIGVPVMFGGKKEEGDEHNGIWLVAFIFQIGTERFELYINLSQLSDDKRYGWRKLK